MYKYVETGTGGSAKLILLEGDAKKSWKNFSQCQTTEGAVSSVSWMINEKRE